MSFQSLGERVLRDIHPNLRLSEDSMIIINQLMSVIMKQIETINSLDELNAIIPQILPGQLANLASSEVNNVIKGSSGSLATTVKEAKERIYIYILSEILETSGNIVLMNGDRIIDAYIILTAIQDDPELRSLFKTVIPMFPYGDGLDIPSIIRNTARGYRIVPGYILAVQDYVRQVLSNLNNTSLSQINSIAQRFGQTTPSNNMAEAHRNLVNAIIGFITTKAISGAQSQKNEEIGFMDVLTVLQRI